MARPTLGYWAIRGLAQPIRLVLAQGGLDYEDRRFTVSQAADGCGALVAHYFRHVFTRPSALGTAASG
jgi:hypothetical protein